MQDSNDKLKEQNKLNSLGIKGGCQGFPIISHKPVDS